MERSRMEELGSSTALGWVLPGASPQPAANQGKVRAKSAVVPHHVPFGCHWR